MLIIGITGPTGSGKTSALGVLKSLGALVIDMDEVYHELLRDSLEMKAELRSRFTGVLRGGEIDRGRLREIVFSDPGALLDLNAITHKYVVLETRRRVSEWERQGGTVAAVDAIALIECGYGAECSVLVAVTAPREKRVSRIVARDKITPEQAEKRIAAQKPDSFFEEGCDFVLENVYNTSVEFEEKCREFFGGLLEGGAANAR